MSLPRSISRPAAVGALALVALLAPAVVAAKAPVNPETKSLPPTANPGYLLGYPTPTYEWHGCKATATQSSQFERVPGAPPNYKGSRQGAVTFRTSLGTSPYISWQVKRGWTICGVEAAVVIGQPDGRQRAAGGDRLHLRPPERLDREQRQRDDQSAHQERRDRLLGLQEVRGQDVLDRLRAGRRGLRQAHQMTLSSRRSAREASPRRRWARAASRRASSVRRRQGGSAQGRSRAGPRRPSRSACRRRSRRRRTRAGGRWASRSSRRARRRSRACRSSPGSGPARPCRACGRRACRCGRRPAAPRAAAALARSALSSRTIWRGERVVGAREARAVDDPRVDAEASRSCAGRRRRRRAVEPAPPKRAPTSFSSISANKLSDGTSVSAHERRERRRVDGRELAARRRRGRRVAGEPARRCTPRAAQRERELLGGERRGLRLQGAAVLAREAAVVQQAAERAADVEVERRSRSPGRRAGGRATIRRRSTRPLTRRIPAARTRAASAEIVVPSAVGAAVEARAAERRVAAAAQVEVAVPGAGVVERARRRSTVVCSVAAGPKRSSAVEVV